MYHQVESHTEVEMRTAVADDVGRREVEVADDVDRREVEAADDVGRREVDVEVVQVDSSGVAAAHLQQAVHAHITVNLRYFKWSQSLTSFEDPFLSEHCESIRFCCPDDQLSGSCSNGLENGLEDSHKYQINIRVFKLSRHGPNVEEIMAGDGNSEEEEVVPAASHWILPAEDFQGMWENLVYDETSANIKSDLLGFVETALLLADLAVDPNIIGGNRVVLLHGPPGSGKTSLCKALAQKLSIRLVDRYPRGGQLIEVNSHSLFSKWFSESGKLVQKMFTVIKDLVDDPESFVCVLIDEVESLTAARTNAMSGTDPGDAVRVVNALLTQLDSIRHCPNVLILTTSNITGAIDIAFVDRADIKQYIGPPGQAAIYKIYYSCLAELARVKILGPPSPSLLPSYPTASTTTHSLPQETQELWRIAGLSQGLSGRSLRKVPLMAFALFAKVSKTTNRLSKTNTTRLSVPEFLRCMELARSRLTADGENLSKN